MSNQKWVQGLYSEHFQWDDSRQALIIPGSIGLKTWCWGRRRRKFVRIVSDVLERSRLSASDARAVPNSSNAALKPTFVLFRLKYQLRSNPRYFWFFIVKYWICFWMFYQKNLIFFVVKKKSENLDFSCQKKGNNRVCWWTDFDVIDASLFENVTFFEIRE